MDLPIRVRHSCCSLEQGVGQAEVDAGQVARGAQVLGGDVALVHGGVPVVALQAGAALGRGGADRGEDELDGAGGELAGPLIWLDENGEPDGHFDVFDYIKLCREHYEKVGIGADYVDKLFR